MVGDAPYRNSNFPLSDFLGGKMKKLRAFGIISAFWGLFGLIVFLSAFLVEEKISRLVNLASGGVLLAMAALFFYLDRKTR